MKAAVAENCRYQLCATRTHSLAQSLLNKIYYDMSEALSHSTENDEYEKYA